MKIRNGFVSNSSTTSFHIYGIALEDVKLMKVDGLKKIKKDKPKMWEFILEWAKTTHKDFYNLLSQIDNLNDERHDNLLSCIYDYYAGLNSFIGTSLGLETYCTYDHYYIGASWDAMKPNETKKEFEKRIEENIEILLGEYADCSYWSGEW
jgi:hypothetical protein